MRAKKLCNIFSTLYNILIKPILSLVATSGFLQSLSYKIYYFGKYDAKTFTIQIVLNCL